jgi:hypothetical protein
LIVEDQVYAMYKVLISSGWRNLYRAGDGIECVQNMINLATCRRPWGKHVGIFTDAELGKLRVMLATDYRWNLGCVDPLVMPDNSSEDSRLKIVTAPALAVSAVAPAHTAPGMEDAEGGAEWGWEEPTWFNIYVHMM